MRMSNNDINDKRHNDVTSHKNVPRGAVRRNAGVGMRNGIGTDKAPQDAANRSRTPQNVKNERISMSRRYVDTGSWDTDDIDGFDSGYAERLRRHRRDSINRYGTFNRDGWYGSSSRRLSKQAELVAVGKSLRQSRRGARRRYLIAIVPLLLSAVLCGYDIMTTGLFEANSNVAGGSVTVPADDIINMATAAIPEPEPDDSIDWAALLRRNSEVKAWMDLQVGNVGIHEPVVQPSAAEGNGYYLKHDLDRRSTYIGNIFYDMRDSDEGTSRLAYGHHFTGSTKMLSSINDAYNQSKFDMMQPMRWRQPDGTDDIYVPVMAMKVYKSYQKCQSFTAKTPAETQGLLQSMASDAQAKSPDFDNIINSAERCITFVTCASNVPNQPWRTLVVFAKMPSN